MPQAFTADLSQRTAGVLLHITSLPNKYPIGNLGPSAFAFIDFLAAAKQTWWQMLPTNPIGAGNSPYSTICSFAGEPMLIDPEWLVAQKLLDAKDLRGATGKSDNKSKKVNFAKTAKFIYPLLAAAFKKFDLKQQDYLRFCFDEQKWLDDYALFRALSDEYRTNLWSKWPMPLRLRDRQAMQVATLKHADKINFHKFTQYCFFQQWQALKSYANDRGVGLVGDIPIFVSFESSDVWSNQKYFWIDEDGQQTFVAGVPPDYFNKNGQRWGNALYRWDELQKDNFSWWIDRFQQMNKQFDLTRIDHFIGFYRYWEIPAAAKDAKTGTWRLTPGDALFAETKKALGSLPFIAEDLGLVTPDVDALREKYGLPSMKILHFAFANDGGKSGHLPCNFTRNCAVYTGTHDNDTTVGWFRAAKKEAKKKKPSFDFSAIEAYFVGHTTDIHWLMIAEAFKSVAHTAIVPLQDILGLGSEARMNIPGTAEGNWVWRYSDKDIRQSHVKRLAGLTQATGRIRQAVKG